MTTDEELTIGQVAARAGIRTSKIRYYESVGLLAEARRRSGHRRYGPDVLVALSLIQFAQDAGFSLPEIRHVLAGFDRKTPPPKRWQSVAERKLREVRRTIDRAQRMEAMLHRLLSCECVRLDDCVDLCGPHSSRPLTSVGRQPVSNTIR